MIASLWLVLFRVLVVGLTLISDEVTVHEPACRSAPPRGRLPPPLELGPIGTKACAEIKREWLANPLNAMLVQGSLLSPFREGRA